MEEQVRTIIWWIRRDLRLSDNEALSAAVAQGDHVLPLFIIDPVFWRPGKLAEKRAAFLLDGLRSLDADLRRCGSRLIVRAGAPLEVLSGFVDETGAEAVYAQLDTSPYARRRDEAVRRALPLELFPGLTVFHPLQVLKSDGSPYIVYTPFSKRWRLEAEVGLAEPLPAPAFIETPAIESAGRIPELPLQSTPVLFPAGEAEAQRRLGAFTAGSIYRYRDARNRPDLDGTSGLSPYLRFGMLSARQAVAAAQAAIAGATDDDGRAGAETWLNELIWREFYQSILFHFPYVREESFRPAYRDLPWENDPEDLLAWQEGQTGYPIVDAAMRQLRQTGWMHNRARMITASFLVKDLLVDWRQGEDWFMRQLIDGDLSANNGGWQWTAGTGTDAAPYFRIFNPVSQSKKFDPDGQYIRRWVPELGSVPSAFIHEPWKMPGEIQSQVNCQIGIDYPEPIIDHAWARERALSRYGA